MASCRVCYGFGRCSRGLRGYDWVGEILRGSRGLRSFARSAKFAMLARFCEVCEVCEILQGSVEDFARSVNVLAS
jgi:hypothetical protein